MSSTTARELRRRRLLLLVLCTLATFALFGSYTGVHADAVPLSSATSAGVLNLDAAKAALLRAQVRVVDDVAVDEAGTGDFYQQISTVNQDLAQAAANDVAGEDGRVSLRTVVGLITKYTEWVAEAAKMPSDSVLHSGCVYYATEMLGPPDDTATTSVMGRLNALRATQLRAADRQASFGWVLWTGWALSALLCVLLLAALSEAHGFARARFRARFNVPLAAAGVLLAAGVGVLVVFTWQTHAGLFHIHGLLRRDTADVSGTGQEITGDARGMRLRSAARYWIFGGGAVLVGLVLWGLQPRINEYRVRGQR